MNPASTTPGVKKGTRDIITPSPPDSLLDQEALDRSPVVANSTMNRERRLTGSNSYARELGFDPLERPHSTLFRWLDLCCGTGRALIEAAGHVAAAGLQERIRIVGVDLVAMFDPMPEPLPSLHLCTGSLPGWSPAVLSPEAPLRFDLITCVHGLHYVGDKLELIRQAVSWLSDGGIFLAHLDPDNVRRADGSPAARLLLRELRRQGLEYTPRTHLLSCRGPRALVFPWQYLGAADAAGPNYTGQPAVDSVYSV